MKFTYKLFIWKYREDPWYNGDKICIEMQLRKIHILIQFVYVYVVTTTINNTFIYRTGLNE